MKAAVIFFSSRQGFSAIHDQMHFSCPLMILVFGLATMDIFEIPFPIFLQTFFILIDSCYACQALGVIWIIGHKIRCKVEGKVQDHVRSRIQLMGFKHCINTARKITL